MVHLKKVTKLLLLELFVLMKQKELKVYFERIEFDTDFTEVIQVIAGGRRERIYDTVAKRIKK